MRKIPGWLAWTVALAVWFGAIGLLAQVVLPTSYMIEFYDIDGTTPIASSSIPQSAYTCAVAPTTAFPAGRVTAYWEDPQNATLQCRYTDPGTGVFVQPPPNVQVVEVAIRGCISNLLADCSPASNRVRYTRRILPGVPGGFGINPPQGVSAQGTVQGPPYVFAGLQVARVGLDVGGEVYIGASQLAVPGYTVRNGDRVSLAFFR